MQTQLVHSEHNSQLTSSLQTILNEIDHCHLRSGTMENLIRAPRPAAPVEAILPPPPGFVAGTQQPKDPVTSFCWILRRHNGSNVYRCKLCSHEFTGQKAVAITHFRSSYSSQRVKCCTGILPEVLKGHLNELLDVKSQDSKKATTKRAYSSLGNGQSIDKQLLGQGSPLADAAILRVLVSNGISTQVVSSDSFKRMTRAICNVGSVAWSKQGAVNAPRWLRKYFGGRIAPM